MANGTLHEHRDVGRAGADVHQHHAQLFFVGGQHGGARGQRAQDQVVHLQAAALHALADVAGGRLGAGDQVRAHLEPHAAHAHRVADAFLGVVDDVFLRDGVQDLLVGRHRDRLGGLEHAVEVGIGHFAAGHRHDARGIAALGVAAGNRGVHGADLAAGHQLGLFDRALDRLHRGLDVHHHAALHAARLVRADADHLDLLARRIFAHQRRHLRRADVQAHDQRLVALAIHALFSSSTATSSQTIANPFV